jgi:hypothetical protein
LATGARLARRSDGLSAGLFCWSQLWRHSSNAAVRVVPRLVAARVLLGACRTSTSQTPPELDTHCARAWAILGAPPTSRFRSRRLANGRIDVRPCITRDQVPEATPPPCRSSLLQRLSPSRPRRHARSRTTTQSQPPSMRSSCTRVQGTPGSPQLPAPCCATTSRAAGCAPLCATASRPTMRSQCGARTAQLAAAS